MLTSSNTCGIIILIRNKKVVRKGEQIMKSKKLVRDVKKYLFDLWEKTHFVKINDKVFDTIITVLTYDIEKQCFEIFRLTDYNFEYAIWIVKKEDVITINNQTIILPIDIKNIINERWKTADYIKINGFSFCTEECFALFTLDKLLILNEEEGTDVASINIKEISSLIIDKERVL